jgi:long-chain acyl-CoA synthetase
MEHDTIVGRFFERAAATPDLPAVHYKQDVWTTLSWSAYADRVRNFAAGLLALGHPEGRPIAVLSFTRVEWCVAELAAMALGGASAGIYTTSSAEEVRYVVEHSEAFVLVVENRERWEKQVKPLQHAIPTLHRVILIEHDPTIDDEMVTSFAEVEELGRQAGQDGVEQRLAAVTPETIGVLIYTSGTTGPPKAVMLSHASMAYTASSLVQMFNGTSDDVMLSYLPMAHVAEQLVSVLTPVTCGLQIYFAESLERLRENLLEARPTLFLAVPRVWEKFHAALTTKLDSATGLKAALLRWARRVGLEVGRRRSRGEAPGLLLGLQHALADRLVYSKIKRAVGFDRLRVAVSGAAPISVDILETFLSLDVPIYELYGMSENCAATSVNRPGATRLGTVGPPFPAAQIKIAEDGEILYRGGGTFSGYLKDEAATAETLRDGWLYTGDLGELDDAGYLRITGRKKDLIITAGGKNIAPQNIEELLKAIPLVAQAVCVGDRRKYIAALLTLDPEKVPEGSTLEQLAGDAALRAELQAAVDAVNQRLARVEQVKRFTVLPVEFTPESGELTPTMKVKRNVVASRYSDQIEALYV